VPTYALALEYAAELEPPKLATEDVKTQTLSGERSVHE